MMRKALVIGLNDYPTQPLTGCVNDATQIANLLANHQNGSRNFDVYTCLHSATKDDVLKKIEELFKFPNEVALLYFSGHGYVDGQNSYVVTTDIAPGNYGIDFNSILSIINNSPAKNKVVILDSCFSGGMGTSSVFGNSNVYISEGTTILTASRNNEVSVEYNGHGLFTMLLIEALTGGAADILGNITLGSVYSYIDRALGAWEQRPLFKTNVSTFLSLRQAEPSIPVECIRSLTKYFTSSDENLLLDPSFEFTNTPEQSSCLIQPYANEENVKIFKNLQLMESVGLVKPVDEQHMYFAAMHSKSCALTPLGRYFWTLVKTNKI